MALQPGGSSLDNIRCRGLQKPHRHGLGQRL
jgi:hypothetical protein